MNKEVYLLEPNDTNDEFTFISEGPRGNIKKKVSYVRMSLNCYNLGFSDFNEKTGWKNDKARSNNGDRDKVLDTVASSVISFLQHIPMQ